MTARISSRVKSGCLAIRAKIQSECSSNGETLPPLRFGAALPVSLQRWHHRITELTPTLKISAISRRDAPLSTASTARSRKSVEYGLGIDLAPQANQFPQIRLGDSGWESLRFNADGKCSNCWEEIRDRCWTYSVRSTFRCGTTCRCSPRYASLPPRLASCCTSRSSYGAGSSGEMRRRTRRTNRKPWARSWSVG